MEGPPVRLRASSIWSLLSCPLRWEKMVLEGRQLASSGPACIGTAVHASTAVFDAARMNGAPVSSFDAAEVAINHLHDPGEEVAWGDYSVRDAEAAALRCHAKYCEEIAPNRNYVAVEETLPPVIIERDGVLIELTGTVDRAEEVTIPSDEAPLVVHGIDDIKTGARAVDAEGNVIADRHTAQIAVYDLLAEHYWGPMRLPPGIIAMQTTRSARVGSVRISHARRALEGDAEHHGFLSFAAMYFKSGVFPADPSSWLCSPKYCAWHARCIYHA